MVLLLLFCGCGKGVEESTASFPLDEERCAMAEELYDFTAALNGKVMQFPLKYTDFVKYGWELKSNHKQVTLKSGQYSIYGVTNGTLETEAYFANLGKEDAKLSECLVCGISVAIPDGVVLELPKGVKLQETDESRLIAAYGEPTEKKDNSLIYVQSQEIGAKFIFEEDKLYEVYLYNILDPEKKEFSDKVPNAVKEYQDPEELSNDLKDFAFYLYGTTYTMPLPLSRLIDGGWLLAGKSVESVPAGETLEDVVKITRSNRTLTLSLRNTADYPTTPENCFVTAIESTSDVKLDMTLANGCRVGTGKGVLEDTYGKENFTRIEKEGKESRYVYSDPDHGTLTVTTNDELGTISSIRVELD